MPLLDGRRLEGPGVRASPGEVTYRVIEPARPVASPGDKRGSGARQRTRLRTGKIIDAAGRFLTECLIYDRSERGGRLRLPLALGLPSTIQLYEDQSATLHQADIVWRKAREIGVRFRPAEATPRTRALEAEMRRRFYAVRD